MDFPAFLSLPSRKRVVGDMDPFTVGHSLIDKGVGVRYQPYAQGGMMMGGR